jgi:hypothetical protein
MMKAVKITLYLCLFVFATGKGFSQEIIKEVLTAKPTDLTFYASGGSSSIDVYTNINYRWSVGGAPSWCKVSKIGSSVSVTCLTNTNSAYRTGSFKITAGNKTATISIYQYAAETTLTATPTSLTFATSGGSSLVDVNTNADTWSVEGAPNWCKVSIIGSLVSVTCSANTGSVRTGSFKITAGSKTETISIYQNAAETTLTATPTSLTFTASGGSSSVNVYTNGDTWSVQGMPSWCTASKYSTSVSITCSTNTGSNRSSSFTITAGNKIATIYISQTAVETTLTATPTSFTFSASGGSSTVNVNTNSNTWSLQGVPSWCKVSKYSSSVSITCSENTGVARTGSITITASDKSVKITISQAAINLKKFDDF